ncbi:MAG: MptD family putative ECF transporter S component [Actinomycetaceae bacterium]|nr:MptD family putative ECF transporter S component [Actinomycetaceae bacterium]
MLINVGVYTALYFVVLAVGASGKMGGPVFLIAGAIVAAVINAAVIMLYLVKTPVFGAMTLLAVLIGGFMVIIHSWVVLPLIVGLGLVADIIVWAGKYRSRWANIFAYALFSTWLVGPFLPVFFAARAYFDEMADHVSIEYAQEMEALFSPTMILGVMVLTFCLTTCAGWVGTRILEKHFASSSLI